MADIKFGTDGWRGVIADEFNFENVAIVAQGISDYIKEENLKNGIIVGYDARFLSEEFAKQVAKVLSANNIKVYLTEQEAPSPAIAYMIKYKALSGGVIITASHNPFKFNGIKFKPYYAGSATVDMTDKIEQKIKLVQQGKSKVKFDEELKNVELVNPKRPYFNFIKKFVNKKIIEKAHLKVIVDPMHGATRNYIDEVYQELGCEVINIAKNRDALFSGRNPEPIVEKNLKLLKEMVKKENANLGIATDGDGDRIGGYDDKCNFIDAHRAFTLILYYLVDFYKKKGEVVRSITSTSMVDILCKAYNLKMYEVKVGFKYICPYILQRDILMGGEESGGLYVKGYIPERDGILSGMFLIEMIANYNKPLSAIFNEISKKFGRLYYKRVDVHLDENKKKKLFERLETNKFDKICNIKVERLNKLDGYKYELEDYQRLMIRSSGTEPIIRIYAEARTDKKAQELIEFADGLVQ